MPPFLVLAPFHVLPIAPIRVDAVQVFVGRARVEFEKAKPVYRGKLLLIPLREVVTAAGGKFNYGPLRKRALISLGRRRVDLSLTGGRTWVNGAPHVLRASPWISKGEVVVPLRFFTEALSLPTVNDPKRNLVVIVSRTEKKAGAKKP